MEDGGGDDQDRRVDEQCHHERDGRVEACPADGFAFALGGARVGARLHDRRMQIEVVRHDGRAEDSDGDVEHFGIGEDLLRGDEEVIEDRRQFGPGEDDLDAEERRDSADEHHHQRLDVAEAAMFEQQDQRERRSR